MNIFHRKKKGDLHSESGSGMKIFLEYAGTPLYELNTDDYTKEIIIGRAENCTWSLNGIDTSASAKHAVVSRRKNRFYITDLGSRNGIYCQNKRIKEKKLEMGDRINLGECVVVVDVFEKRNRKAPGFHRLEFTSEKGRKRTVDLIKPQTVIGSQSDCDIVFPDQLVSSRHAELQQRNDGSCWIRDLGSRNGTSVNGTELPPDGERMLKDNDNITIAYIDIRFLDAAMEHHESKIWTAVITLAVTVLIIMGGYIGYMKLSPNSNEILRMAVEEMNSGHLDAARKLIAEAAYVENADNTQYERAQLEKRITQWENIIRMWASVKADLCARQYDRATQKLSSIDHDDLNAWTWPDGAIEKRKAQTVKKLLDSSSSTSAALRGGIATVEDIEDFRRRLSAAITEAAKNNDDYLTQVIKDAKLLLKRIDKTLEEDKELQTVLALLNTASPDYSAIITRLEKISRESAGPVKARADKVLPAVLSLDRETRRMLVMVDKVCDLDFPAVRDFKIDLPETIDYSSEKNIGNLKRSLIDTADRFKDTTLQLSLIHRALVEKGVDAGKPFPVLEVFLDNGVMDQVYAFDCLDMPLPALSRETPCGKYDELLGIEFFYDYVSNIHSQIISLNIEELPFKPVLYRAKEAIRELERFIRFADRDENQWFNRGRFERYLAHCRKILAERNEIVERQLKRPSASGSREFLVSRGIAAYLAPEKKAAELNPELEKSFSAFKRELLTLNREYNIAMPEDALRIRNRIIKVGLPGDPILKRMWKQRPAAGWSK